MILQIIDIHKYFFLGKEKIHALNGINLNIEQGEFVAIQGPSGAGKSTLLHVIGGLERPDGGEVRYKGEEIYSWDDRKLSIFRNEKIGFVFQFFHLLSELNLLENIMLPALIQGVNFQEAKKRALELVSFFELEHRLSSFPAQLSGGEQQRVAIARALVNNPDILLCDEPTGNLDSRLGEEVLKFISKINKQGHTVIMVTHNQEIAHWARVIIYMKDGKFIGKEDVG